MNTKVIFNTDKKLKEAAMKKARREGMSYTAFLNIATRAYVDDSLKIAALTRDLAQAREDIREGRVFSEKEVYKRLGIKMPR